MESFLECLLKEKNQNFRIPRSKISIGIFLVKKAFLNEFCFVSIKICIFFSEKAKLFSTGREVFSRKIKLFLPVQIKLHLSSNNQAFYFQSKKALPFQLKKALHFQSN